ncbi:MAG: peptidoglycan -binding protein [Alphaproteobacteria bacterium]|nr:peptidoglycan -binding protein [Alphaproteobacteria bacterium]
MISSRRRGRAFDSNVWPGFVDALTTLVMVVSFLLMVFVLAQFFLSQLLSTRDEQLRQINRQLAELAEVLAMERRVGADLRQSVADLSLQLQAATVARDSLTQRLEDALARALQNQTALDQAKAEIAEAKLTVLADKEKIEVQLAVVAGLQAEIEALVKRRRELESEVAAERDVGRLTAQALGDATRAVGEREAALAGERDLSRAARDDVARLSRQIAEFRAEITRLAALLELGEKAGADKDARIADLGRQLNRALAQKVEELARYRSEFFGRLREVLGGRADVRIVGDRFVFQSEVLFDTASAELGPEGKRQLRALAVALKEIAARIPPGTAWLLRVDGHTDKRPIRSAQFPSNWELSTARALSVVRFLNDAGVPAERLAATGFGEFQAIDDRDDEIAYRRNRRIELKLTDR